MRERSGARQSVLLQLRELCAMLTKHAAAFHAAADRDP
jgi:hypothetical protein